MALLYYPLIIRKKSVELFTYSRFLFTMILAGRPGVLRLDRPANNFDVAGIPREEWSSGLCSCHENILPSCVCSCCCTPVVFGQVRK